MPGSKFSSDELLAAVCRSGVTQKFPGHRMGCALPSPGPGRSPPPSCVCGRCPPAEPPHLSRAFGLSWSSTSRGPPGDATPSSRCETTVRWSCCQPDPRSGDRNAARPPAVASSVGASKIRASNRRWSSLCRLSLSTEHATDAGAEPTVFSRVVRCVGVERLLGRPGAAQWESWDHGASGLSQYERSCHARCGLRCLHRRDRGDGLQRHDRPSNARHTFKEVEGFVPRAVDDRKNRPDRVLSGLIELDISFTDAAGNRWSRSKDGDLRYLYNLSDRRPTDPAGKKSGSSLDSERAEPGTMGGDETNRADEPRERPCRADAGDARQARYLGR